MQKFIKYNFNIKFSIRRNYSIEERLPDYLDDYAIKAKMSAPINEI
ncbi:hypothetical protein [uncultured Clostridium sp.]